MGARRVLRRRHLRDQPAVHQALQRPVQRSGSRPQRPARRRLHLVRDGVPVRVPSGQRQQDVQRDRAQRQGGPAIGGIVHGELRRGSGGRVRGDR